MPDPAPEPPSPQPDRGRVHLPFLDGLRGLAALYVVLGHTGMEAEVARLPGVGRLVLSSLAFGRFAVGLFIVLSGFCLMLPLARRGTTRLDGGAKRFLARRAYRILPPYYAALALSLLAVALVPGMGHRTGHSWDAVLPALTPRAIATHLLLVHNLSGETVYRVNHALWSVATECQIYVLFPLLLLPALRRLGPAGMLAVAVAVGLSVHFAYPDADLGRPWYLALFAMGAVAALLSFAPTRTTARTTPRTPARWCTIAAAAGSLATLVGSAKLLPHVPPWLDAATPQWLMDLFAGTAAAALLVACTADRQRAAPTGRPAAAVRCLELPPIVRLGTVSYSLYLIHPPVVAAAGVALRLLHLSPVPYALAVYALAPAASLAAAALFFTTVERRFLHSKGPIPQPRPAPAHPPLAAAA